MNKRSIDFNEYKGYVGKICRDITLNSKWRPDYVVGITRGGLLAATMISHYLNVPMHTLNVSLRDSDTSPESNLWMAEDAWGYDGMYMDNHIYDEYKQKNILIVDDINDTGSTINWIVNDWQTSCLPDSDRWNTVWGNNVRFAVIADKLSSGAVVNIDYVGFEVDENNDNTWIDFPYEEWWTK